MEAVAVSGPCQFVLNASPFFLGGGGRVFGFFLAGRHPMLLPLFFSRNREQDLIDLINTDISSAKRKAIKLSSPLEQAAEALVAARATWKESVAAMNAGTERLG